jgi:hypothetical protein
VVTYDCAGFQGRPIQFLDPAMGLAQRFNDQVATTIRAPRQPFQPAQQQQFGLGFGFGSPLQQMLAGKVTAGAIPFDVINPVEIGRMIAQVTIADFQRTQSFHQSNTNAGGGLARFSHL